MEYKLLTPEKQQEIINELILEAEETHFRNNLWKQMEEGKTGTTDAVKAQEFVTREEAKLEILNNL